MINSMYCTVGCGRETTWSINVYSCLPNPRIIDRVNAGRAVGWLAFQAHALCWCWVVPISVECTKQILGESLVVELSVSTIWMIQDSWCSCSWASVCTQILEGLNLTNPYLHAKQFSFLCKHWTSVCILYICMALINYYTMLFPRKGPFFRMVYEPCSLWFPFFSTMHLIPV